MKSNPNRTYVGTPSPNSLRDAHLVDLPVRLCRTLRGRARARGLVERIFIPVVAIKGVLSTLPEEGQDDAVLELDGADCAVVGAVLVSDLEDRLAALSKVSPRT